MCIRNIKSECLDSGPDIRVLEYPNMDPDKVVALFYTKYDSTNEHGGGGRKQIFYLRKITFYTEMTKTKRIEDYRCCLNTVLLQYIQYIQ